MRLWFDLLERAFCVKSITRLQTFNNEVYIAWLLVWMHSSVHEFPAHLFCSNVSLVCTSLQNEVYIAWLLVLFILFKCISCQKSTWLLQVTSHDDQTTFPTPFFFQSFKISLNKKHGLQCFCNLFEIKHRGFFHSCISPLPYIVILEIGISFSLTDLVGAKVMLYRFPIFWYVVFMEILITLKITFNFNYFPKTGVFFTSVRSREDW